MNAYESIPTYYWYACKTKDIDMNAQHITYRYGRLFQGFTHIQPDLEKRFIGHNTLKWLEQEGAKQTHEKDKRK